MNGNTINGYKILRMLGSGGMADVYFAENILEMPAAIKVLKKKYYDDKSIRDRFKNEALIMKSLDHPNIRKVIDYFENDGYAMIVMEFVEGMTLKDLMDVKKTISDETMHKYFEQCISALNYTHSRGIVHRDIKPSNIFITTAGDVKLVDYGIAKSDSGNSHTMTGQTLGTIIYMSPEQIIDPKRVTYKTDIYSMGVTFYQALIGKPPYDAKTGSEFTIQQKIVYENLDLTIIPIHWRSKLESCLRKKAEDRSMPMHTSKGDTIVDTPLPPPPPPQLTTNSKWIYYILGGTVLAIAIGGYFAKRETPEWKLQKRIISEIRSDMVKVDGGTFTMGSTYEQGQIFYDNEYPAHEEEVRTFYISKNEVTQEQYKAIMWNNPSNHKNCSRCPVEEVSWYDAQEFIKKLNELSGETYRLPSSVEWEYAARGGQKSRGYKYSGSNESDDVAWSDGNSSQKTHPVGGKQSNELGLNDMSGNVWEWCSDKYSKDYNSPRNSTVLEIRGGSWSWYSRFCRVALRSYDDPSYRGNDVGFRLCRTLSY